MNVNIAAGNNQSSMSKYDSAVRNKENTFSVHGRGSLGVQEEGNGEFSSVTSQNAVR